MAGFYKIYMVVGSGGFLGADAINPIAFPNISTEGYPKELAAQTTITAVR